MIPDLSKLIAAIISHVNSKSSFVSKTKLLKLLYLFDVEYYRLHRQTFTGFDWIYFHLGPWFKDYDSLLDSFRDSGVISSKSSQNSAYDTEFLSSSEFVELDGLFESYKDEFALKNILRTWGESLTGEILDYVYFTTEPMQNGERYKPLDFSTISESRPEQYTRTSSGVTKAAILTARENLRKQLEANRNENVSKSTKASTEYDELFFESLDIIEEINS